jgi:chromosome segregation ATPase
LVDAVATGRRLWRGLIALAVVGGCAFALLTVLVIGAGSDALSEARANAEAGAALQARLEQVGGSLATANQQVAAATARRQALADQISASERDVARLSGEIEALRHQRAEVHAGLVAAQTELEALQARIADAASQVPHTAAPPPQQQQQQQQQQPQQPVKKKTPRHPHPASAN